MDDNDREEIISHMGVITENQGNLAANVNKQIQINSYFNETITNFKNIVESDRNRITKTYQMLTEHEKRLFSQQLRLDQMLKIEMLKEKLNQIIDNIALVRLGIVHPSMLTTDEIKTMNLDFYKLKNVRTGLLEHDKNTIVIAIKVPDLYKIVNYKLITPMPTESNLEIVLEDIYILEINETKYEFNGNIQYERELKPLNNCITNNNCKLIVNKQPTVRKIDETTILCKNMCNHEIVNMCDDRKIKLNGNFMLNVNNCSIKILNETLSNRNMKFIDRFFYTDEEANNFTENLKFENIDFKNFENLEEIKLTKFHKSLNYINFSSIFIVITILTIVIFVILAILRKHKNMSNNFENLEKDISKIVRIQENSFYKGREVMYNIPNSEQIRNILQQVNANVAEIS